MSARRAGMLPVVSLASTVATWTPPAASHRARSELACNAVLAVACVVFDCLARMTYFFP